MSQVEKYIGESKLKDEVRKKLVLKIKEGSITPEHLSNEVVDEVIQPLVDAAKEDLQEQIDTVVSEGMSPEDREKLNNLPTGAEFEAEISALEDRIDAIKGFNYELVSTLPTASADTTGTIYLVPSADAQSNNIKDEYITIQDGNTYKWEQIGSTAIDLSGYATTSAVNAKYTKPDTGIPSTDLASTVQTSLGKADTALQAQDISGKQDVINDLATIRSGAAAGATAVQPAQMNTALEAKADKSDTYTKAEIGNLIVPANTEIIVTDTLPATGTANTIYRVPDAGGESYTDYGWDGTQFVDLATYDGDLNHAVMVTPQNFTERQRDIALENLGLETSAGAMRSVGNENGFFVTDKNGNIGAQVVDGKIDALGLGDNLSEIVEDVASEAVKAAAVHSETKEDGFYITDAQGNVGAEVVDGKFDALGLGDNLKEIVGALSGDSVPRGTIQNLAESFVAAHAELARMRDEVSRMSESMLSIKNAGGHNYMETITIPMSQAQEDLTHGVFRIGLHYGSQLGSEIWHEVFFGGNVNKDFSDVRIKDANGKILPTRLLHSGNYEVVQDYRLRGSDDSMRYYDGAFYWTNGKKIHVTNDDFETSTELPGQTVKPSNFYFDNFGGLWFNDYDTNKVYYCRRVNGSYDFLTQIEVADLTVTNGETNTNIRMQDLVQDAQGYVYFGTYQTNFNVVIFKTTNPVTANGITADGSGNYVFERYNQPRVYKDGQIDPDYCDQHVHHLDMFYAQDGNGNQVCNIIAGLDNSNTEKGPNIISSIDGGVTWVSFRDTIDTIDWIKYRGHDYSFTWMSSDNSFTILGGENNVLGGPALGKMHTKVDTYGRIIPTEVAYTWDGLTGMRRVTSDGDNWIMLPLVAVYQNNYNSIVVSEDGAKTWHSIYTEYKRVNQGVGQGVRKLSNLIRVTNPSDPTPCWYGRGYNTAKGNMPPIRVYKGGEHYYGELLVDVGECEAGTDIVLTVESGYMAAAPDAMVFERTAANAAGAAAPVWELPLHEGYGDVVRDSNGIAHTIKGDYEWGSPDSTMYFYNSIPRIKGYEEGGGLRLGRGAYIDLGQIPQLKFNKGFSVVMWLSLHDLRWTENYYQLWPIIGCDDFVIGRTLNGFYVGGKASGTFSRGLVSIPNVRGVFIPMMITVSADTIPVVTGYIGENDSVIQNVVVASTWPSALLSTLNLRVGTPEIDTETTHGELNKDCFIQGLAIYDKVLTQDEFRTLINGRSITSDYDIITK